MALAMICMMSLSSFLLPAMASSSPAPKSFVQIWGEIESRTGVNALDLNIFAPEAKDIRRENVPQSLPGLSKSLWFVDNDDYVRSIINVYDNHGAVKHYRDQVMVTVREVGQGEGGCYFLLDGKDKTFRARGEVISSYPYEFIDHTQVLISSRHVDPDAPYTIFTAGTLELTNPGETRAYTRFESNLYIYWDDSHLPEAPGNIGFLYDPTSEHMVLTGVDSTMEYRLKSQTPDDWQPCTNEPIYFDCSTKPVAYYVRYAAANGNDHSQTKEVILPAQKTSPGATRWFSMIA